MKSKNSAAVTFIMLSIRHSDEYSKAACWRHLLTKKTNTNACISRNNVTFINFSFCFANILLVTLTENIFIVSETLVLHTNRYYRLRLWTVEFERGSLPSGRDDKVHRPSTHPSIRSYIHPPIHPSKLAFPFRIGRFYELLTHTFVVVIHRIHRSTRTLSFRECLRFFFWYVGFQLSANSTSSWYVQV